MPPRTSWYRAAPAFCGTSRSSLCRRFLGRACPRARALLPHVLPAPFRNAYCTLVPQRALCSRAQRSLLVTHRAHPMCSVLQRATCSCA
eukprot:6176729-Pleurochrysis_carterae.AAC.1